MIILFLVDEWVHCDLIQARIFSMVSDVDKKWIKKSKVRDMAIKQRSDVTTTRADCVDASGFLGDHAHNAKSYDHGRVGRRHCLALPDMIDGNGTQLPNCIIIRHLINWSGLFSPTVLSNGIGSID